MNIAVASDHAGFRLKSVIVPYLSEHGWEVIDTGTYSEDPVDYPDYIGPAAERVARGKSSRGIVMGGSGNGEAMTANRIQGVRCAVCWNVEAARLARAHNNANMIALGAWFISSKDALYIVDMWLKTDFEGGRHARRIFKIDR